MAELNELLDQVEARFLVSKNRQRVIKRMADAYADLIDLGSASSMNLASYLPRLDQAWLGKEFVHIAASYPAKHSTDNGLEQTVVNYFAKWTGLQLSPGQVSIFSGVYGSYRSLLQLWPGRPLLVPEFIHQTHKACFAALGHKVIEVRNTENGLLDLADLQNKFDHSPDAILFINHNRGPKFNSEYFLKIANILNNYSSYCLYDADVVLTSHDGTRPYLPLAVTEFAARSIFLGNLTKELGLPGIRIGYGISAATLAQQIHKLQQVTLDIIPAPDRLLANLVMQSMAIDEVRNEFKARMLDLVAGFNQLGWQSELPAFGVNLFIATPPSFQGQEFPADELFCFYLLQETKVLLRPGSTHGDRITTQVRLVTCQDRAAIAKVFERLKQAGIHYTMPLPADLINNFKSYIQ
jgi:aspartate/methionine/tyrosine aminotransferase